MAGTDRKIKSVQLPVNLYVIAGGAIAVVLVFLMLFNYPAYQSLRKIESKITETEYRLKVQQTLYPFYLALKKKEGQRMTTTLPWPDKEAIPVNRVDEIPSMIKDIARRSGKLHVVSVIPDVNTMDRKARRISVNIELKGDFPVFRDFMSGLGGLPCLEEMENIRIETVHGSNLLFMKIWLLVE
ncbi:MAG: hypothetical protein GY737_00820 [Desulfobacteraceae bacterium]|nr:hypothetical protein [Desulfobacteraceae bacterium]